MIEFDRKAKGIEVSVLHDGKLDIRIPMKALVRGDAFFAVDPGGILLNLDEAAQRAVHRALKKKHGG